MQLQVSQHQHFHEAISATLPYFCFLAPDVVTGFRLVNATSESLSCTWNMANNVDGYLFSYEVDETVRRKRQINFAITINVSFWLGF